MNRTNIFSFQFVLLAMISAWRRVRSTFVLLSSMVLLAGSVAAQSITLVGEDDWYPYSALKDGRLQGFAVEVIAAAYASVDVNVSFKSAPYVRCLMLVETGQELGCFDSLKDSKLSADFLFHQEPIFKAEIGIYALSISEESGLRASDMRGRRVGLTHGYTYTDVIDKDESIVREEAPTDLSNLRKLLLKRSEYSLVYTRVVDYLQGRYPKELQGKVKQVGSITVDKLYVSFSKRRPESAKLRRCSIRAYAKFVTTVNTPRLNNAGKTLRLDAL